jgi:hypothetical protein
LHCGDPDRRRRKEAEALGRMPESGFSDFCRIAASPALPAAFTSGMAGL